MSSTLKILKVTNARAFFRVKLTIFFYLYLGVNIFLTTFRTLNVGKWTGIAFIFFCLSTFLYYIFCFSAIFSILIIAYLQYKTLSMKTPLNFTQIGHLITMRCEVKRHNVFKCTVSKQSVQWPLFYFKLNRLCTLH